MVEAVRKPAADAAGPIIRMAGVTKTFPGVKALDDVSLDVMAGEVHALLGENGAGKSTLIKILAGAYRMDAGTIELDGTPVSFEAPADALAAGVKVVFQEIALIPEFTVAENIFMENHPRNPAGLVDWRTMRQKAQALFDRAGFALDVDAPVKDLSLSEQQLVEISRALAHDARVVVMDEPTSSLTPGEVEHLFGVIGRLRDMGIGIVYVSHKLEEIFAICDRATVLRDGRWVSTKPVAEHDHHSLIVDMVGREITDLFPKTRHQGGETVVSVKNLSTRNKLADISFDVRAGEVLGFFGLMGAGRTELAKAVVGYDPISAGEISIGGERLRPHNTGRAKALGIGLLSEDRKEEGLMLEADVTRNMTLPSLARFARAGFVDAGAERARAQTFVDRFRIRLASLDQPIRTLSGGNQQKVLLSRWLMYGLKAIVVDEPTRGIDVGAKAEIFAAINELAAGGLAVIMMTSEMPELLNLSDRIAVLAEGRMTALFDRDEATQEKVLNAAIG
ncbi:MULTISPECIES: sugar ABC transporter ATP-binding protein [unclassified Roseitalea]|uniref:sugar ABC transporter ATP-binding protein n=1 Tax=unclassified Roseitalea TaxID=2639107 RepID=UPI00273E9A78|nr:MULTISPECIES: sugar ABC transporter ATP-binding protein [unclassified Roseitalea]